jgi:lambda repressor-like predicted transcriptional regulator
MAVHRGKILEEAIKEKGITCAAAAKRCNISRRTLYNYFENPEISWDKLVEIEEILKLSLPEKFTELRKYSLSDTTPSILKESEEIAYWRNKYIDLLEKYTLHLETR